MYTVYLGDYVGLKGTQKMAVDKREFYDYSEDFNKEAEQVIMQQIEREKVIKEKKTKTKKHYFENIAMRERDPNKKDIVERGLWGFFDFFELLICETLGMEHKEQNKSKDLAKTI